MCNLLCVLPYTPDIPVESPGLKHLLKELGSKVASQWETIGIMLDIEEGLVDNIKADYKGDSNGCLREMFKVWLKRTNPEPTWSAVVSAVEVLGDQKLAKDLSDKYCKP